MMDVKKFLTKRIVLWLISGLLVGALADEVWWRWRESEVRRQLSQVQASEAETGRRVTELQGKLAAADTELKRLRDEWEAERSLRHQYEELLNRGRK